MEKRDHNMKSKPQKRKINYRAFFILGITFFPIGILLILSIARSFLEQIAALLGIYYTPSALFLIGGLVAMAGALHFTAVVSKLADENRLLAQRMAILEEGLQREGVRGDESAEEP